MELLQIEWYIRYLYLQNDFEWEIQKSVVYLYIVIVHDNLLDVSILCIIIINELRP